MSDREDVGLVLLIIGGALNIAVALISIGMITAGWESYQPPAWLWVMLGMGGLLIITSLAMLVVGMVRER